MVTTFRPKIGVGVGTAYSSQRNFAEQIRQQMKVITDNYSDMVNNVVENAPEILLEALEPTFAMSQEMVPEKTGKLKNSGYLLITSSGQNAAVEMGYAKNGEPDYAVVVHEDLDVHHAPPTGAKFLQYPLTVDEGNIQARILLGFAEATGLSESGGAWHG